MARKGPYAADVHSSVPLQILFYSNAWYFALYFIAEVLIFAYKGETLPYPSYNLGAECTLLVVFLGVEAVRNFFGQKGNLTEQMAPVIFSIVLSAPILITTLYFLLWQTYVLRLEVILAAIQLTFLLVEFIFSIVAVATFARASPL